MRLSDVIWTGVVRSRFLRNNAWLLFTLLLFLISHGMLHGEDSASRSTIFVCRMLIYVFAMPVLIHGRVRHIRQAIRDRELVQLGCIPVPAEVCRQLERTSSFTPGSCSSDQLVP